MKKNILKIFMVSSLAAALILSGCTPNEESEVIAPEDSAHVSEDATDDRATTEEETAEEATKETSSDDVAYDPDKEDTVFEEFKVSLFDGYSLIKAKDFLKENIKYLSVEKADEAVLALENRLKENQNYYINQVMAEEVQNAILLAYNLEENSLSIDDFKDDAYKTIVQNILDNGYKFFPEEGLFYPVVDYRALQIYDKYTSDEIRSYLEIFARDSDAPSSSIDDRVKMLEELSERLVLAEAHLMAYPEGQTFDMILDAYEMYMHFYTVSMAYMGGFDADTKIMDQELIDSYETFVKENPETVSTAVLKEYLEILEGHHYEVDNHVLNFLQDIKDVIMKHMSTLTVK